MRTLLAVMFCLAVSPLAAYEGKEGKPPKEPTPQEMASKRVEHMDKALDLTPDQKEKVGKILESSGAEMQELHKKLQKLERETNEKIRVLLKDEQKEKFDMMRARQKMMGHGMRQGKPGMGPRKGQKGGMGPGGKEHPAGEHPKEPAEPIPPAEGEEKPEEMPPQE